MARILNLRKDANRISGTPHRDSARHERGSAPEQARSRRLTTTTPEYDELVWHVSIPHPRGTGRIVLALLGIAIGIGFFFFRAEVLPGIVFLLIGASLLLPVFIAHKKEVTVTMTEHEVIVEDTPYPYTDFTAFWIEYIPNGVQQLIFRSRKWYLPYIVIPLGSMNPLPIRSLLIRSLPEQELNLSVVETIVKKMGL